MSDVAGGSTDPIPSSPSPPNFQIVRGIMRRMVFGLLFLLPILLTILAVIQIYRLLNSWVIAPVALLIVSQGIKNPYWTAVEQYVTPPISLLAVMLLLYIMGHAFQTRINHAVDWLFGSIPGVSILYRAIRDASQAMQGPDGIKNIDTVVLVPFPHPNARATGFLMGESEDSKTGRALACVYIPIALFPPSGYTLLFPREDVINTQWEATAPWKLLLSGGLTVPKSLPFSSDASAGIPAK